MPLIRVTSNQSLPSAQAGAFLANLSRVVSELFEKPERWVMTCLDPVATMTFAGSDEPAAYVEVKNIGPLDAALADRVSELVCAAVGQALGVAAHRIYVEMTAADGARWGWDGGTFG